ncbi:hypothetical protein [Hymenobacter cellulosilyticus]|uniref:STAS/SEC14 domain-containing protein n=1 Tax=Hymenobacter cellulosilyticus TaxID=2932248 RepID=A0A8T9Q6U2_9BACT|nr:hypothetical protein [Hymenobacter cellulosilyticus]UOQ73287.1 hypothetical protein MUN79_04780 [Hymenobacter cellulosilyticus]
MSSEPISELLHLVYRPDLNIFVGRWGYQPEIEQLPAVYEELRRLGEESGCRFWLQDIRRRSFNDPATTQWLLTDFFPAIGRRLGGQLCVAYLASPTLKEAIMAGPSFRSPEFYDQEPFVVAFFGDEGEAISWLHERQRRAGLR